MKPGRTLPEPLHCYFLIILKTGVCLRRQMMTFWAKDDTGRSHWMRLVSFVSAVENLCLQKKLHSIKQRSGIHPAILSEAKLAYPTAWAMGEEGKVVSFLKGFSDRAFAGHLLRTGRADTLGTASGSGEGSSPEKRTPGDGRRTHGSGCGTDKSRVGKWVSADS